MHGKVGHTGENPEEEEEVDDEQLLLQPRDGVSVPLHHVQHPT
jgi:hypothetical protein